MDHSAVITNNVDGFAQPIHVQCSCGTAGDFATVQAASDWMIFRHFNRLGVIDTYSLTSGLPSDSKKPINSFPPKTGSTYTPKLPSAPTPTTASTSASLPKSEAEVAK